MAKSKLKLSKRERAVEKIVLILLALEPDKHDPTRTYDITANEAADMAYRANKALTDRSWWNIIGLPHWNERMARIKAALRKNVLKKKRGGKNA